MSVTWDTQPGTTSSPTDGAAVPSQFTWMGWDVTSDVQAFVDGSQKNFGWQIKDEVPWHQFNIPRTKFHSKEFGGFYPHLEVVFDSTPSDGDTWGSIKALFN